MLDTCESVRDTSRHEVREPHPTPTGHSVSLKTDLLKSGGDQLDDQAIKSGILDEDIGAPAQETDCNGLARGFGHQSLQLLNIHRLGEILCISAELEPSVRSERNILPHNAFELIEQHDNHFTECRRFVNAAGAKLQKLSESSP